MNNLRRISFVLITILTPLTVSHLILNPPLLSKTSLVHSSSSGRHLSSLRRKINNNLSPPLIVSSNSSLVPPLFPALSLLSRLYFISPHCFGARARVREGVVHISFSISSPRARALARIILQGGQERLAFVSRELESLSFDTSAFLFCPKEEKRVPAGKCSMEFRK